MLMTVIFCVLLALGVFVVAKEKLDTDPGGYEDGWTTKALFPDKGVHAVSAACLTLAGAVLGVHPAVAGTAVLLAGIAFERVQGYVSKYDIAADALGALVGTLIGLAGILLGTLG